MSVFRGRGSVGGSGSGISSETNTWALPSAASNPSSPYTLASITGSTVQRITALAGNLTLNKPTFSGTAPTGRTWALFSIAATGGTRTISAGSGVTHNGIGTDIFPLAIAASTTAEALLYTDDGGTTWNYGGDYDFATNAATVRAALGINTEKLVLTIENPVNGTYIITRENYKIGTIGGMLAWTDTGSATANLQIADKTGASDYTVTGAASVTSLSAVSVTTTPARTAATAANTMARSGTTDRILQLVLTSVTSSPTLLQVEIDYTP